MPVIFSASDKLVCAERELAMRRAVYPKWVASKKMSQAKADREIALMEAIAADYLAAANSTETK